MPKGSPNAELKYTVIRWDDLPKQVVKDFMAWAKEERREPKRLVELLVIDALKARKQS